MDDEWLIENKYHTIMGDISMLTLHSDLRIPPPKFRDDLFHVRVFPSQECNWYQTAYKFGHHPNIKYHKMESVYPIDGQPRVFRNENGIFDYIRFVAGYDKWDNIAFEIVARQPSTDMAERQLLKYYSLWKERHDMEPMDVFRKFLCMD